MNLWEANDQPAVKLRLTWNFGREYYSGIYLCDDGTQPKKYPPGKIVFIDKNNQPFSLAVSA